jgi:hypothetical protein
MILPDCGLAIYEAEVVTNPTLGIEQIIWSDIPHDDSEQSVRSVFQPTRPSLASPYLHLGSWIEVLGIHASNSEVLEEDVT